MVTIVPDGTLVTVFPQNVSDFGQFEPVPAAAASSPIGLLEYLADCHDGYPDIGNPVILAIRIATPFRNAAAGSNVSLTVQWIPPHAAHPYQAANWPRFALMGHLEDIADEDVAEQKIAECYKAAHPDVFWTPDHKHPPHVSGWVRLIVKEIYWFGGFGDRAHIGWFPLEMYQGVTRKEIEAIRLVGEKD